MKHSIIPTAAAGAASEPLPVLPRLARTLLLAQLRKVQFGRQRLWRERFTARRSDVQMQLTKPRLRRASIAVVNAASA